MPPAWPVSPPFRQSFGKPTTATSLMLALVENVAREDLSPIDEARRYSSLMDEFGLSLGEVCRARRPFEAHRLQSRSAPRAARRRAGTRRARPAERGPRPCRARGSRSRGAPAAGSTDRPPGSLGEGGRAGRPLGRRSNPTAGGVPTDRPGVGRAGPRCAGKLSRAPTSASAGVASSCGSPTRRSWPSSSRPSSGPHADCDWPPDAEGRAATIARRRAISSVG